MDHYGLQSFIGYNFTRKYTCGLSKVKLGKYGRHIAQISQLATLTGMATSKRKNEMVVEFQRQLKDIMIKLRTELPEAAIVYVDVYAIKLEKISNPKRQGVKSQPDAGSPQTLPRLTLRIRTAADCRGIRNLFRLVVFIC
ncbi:hypothetical protein ACFE04_029828 [Oxalis oulophora]